MACPEFFKTLTFSSFVRHPAGKFQSWSANRTVVALCHNFDLHNDGAQGSLSHDVETVQIWHTTEILHTTEWLRFSKTPDFPHVVRSKRIILADVVELSGSTSN